METCQKAVQKVGNLLHHCECNYLHVSYYLCGDANHEDLCELGRVRNILSKVLLNLSTWPFPSGWYGVVLEGIMPHDFCNCLKT